MTELTSLRDLAIYLGQLDKDNVPEGLLGVVGDTDGTDVGSIVELDVFVVGGVSSRCRESRSASM